MKILKSAALFILPVICVSLLVLWPSFKLALTGDDYLGLWRYHYYLDGHTPQNWNNFKFFFTDYGPQDTYTAIIHNFFGFTPLPYYLISNGLRLLAAFSFYPLVLFITKNKKAAYMAILFFAVSTTGLETTDWSFNMPSYTAIALLNLFLLVYLNTKVKATKKNITLSTVLLYLTIIAQPIRMMFLPGFLLLYEVYGIVRKRDKKTILISGLRLFLFAVVAITVYTTGYVGNSIGAGETLTERLNGGWKKVIANNFTTLMPHLQNGEYELLLYPVAQFGSEIFPTNLIPQNYQSQTVKKALVKLALPLLLLYLAIIISISKTHKTLSKKYTSVAMVAGIFWTTLIFLTFIVFAQQPYTKSQFIAITVGGYMLILIACLYIKKFTYPSISDGLVLATLLAILSFLTPWFRNPTFLLETYGRYLIVPAAGLTLLLSIIISSARNKLTANFLFTLFLVIMALHMVASASYLHHLSEVRESKKTQAIRQSIPYVKNFGKPNTPLMFYFEPKDSEILHHALLFGFPVIIGDQYNFFNVWGMAYTDNWDEVVAAYKDGSSLKRFSIPVKKVPLQDIYSFKLVDDTLVNTSDESRKRLLELNQISK